MRQKANQDNFIDIPFTVENLDRFVVRSSILQALRAVVPIFVGRFLDVGCGKMPYKHFIMDKSKVDEYVGLDIETANQYDVNIRPDFTWDGITMPFADGSFDSLMATEVLEHCPLPEVTLKEIFRVLRPGGVFFFTTPFLWNLHEVPNDEYRFTPFSLDRHLNSCGFIDIQINATGGWHTSLAQMLGLWVRRSSLSPRKRKILSLAIKPLMRKLLQWDANTKISFSEGAMVNSLYGIAKK